MTDRCKLNEILASPRVSRREFIRYSVAAGLTATSAAAMFDAAKAATPQKGGHYIQAITGGGANDVLDPAQTLDSFMINVSFGQLRNNLTEIDPNNQLIPELAESWEASPDASVWTFTLREGITFHNGKSLEAEDVVASLNHHRGADTKSAAKGIIEPVTDVRADGKRTVVVTLEAGNADFPFLVSDYHLCICPANPDGTIDWRSGVGTGSYVLENFDPGISTKVKRNPNYWKPDRAYFDSIDNLFISDATARTNGVMTGSIHSMSNLDLKTVHLLERNPNLQVFATNGNKHAVFPMFCDVAPFDDVNVRLALKYAIDRPDMLKKIARGMGELGNDNPVGPANIYRATTDELPQRVYDPEKAKFHLKKAGLETLDVKLHLADTAFEGAVDAGQLFAETAKAAGINLEVAREANDGYWSNTWMKQPFVGSYWGGRPTEDWVFSQIYSKGADWNESHWDNARFNELLVQARSELDTGKRREMYVEMQRLVNEDGGTILPMFMAYTHAASSKIGLPEQMAANWELDGHKNAERWWFNG